MLGGSQPDGLAGSLEEGLSELGLAGLALGRAEPNFEVEANKRIGRGAADESEGF